MPPHMSDRELALFSAFLAKSARYLEFGCGGSTVLASAQARDWIIAVDSAPDWLERVARSCAGTATAPELVHADIGPVGDWGYPVDPATRPQWSVYHASVFQLLPKSWSADFVMVDGRFRVACFAQAVIHCAPTTLIGIHDFASRPFYHIVHQIGREIAVANDLSFFLPRSGARDQAARILEAFSETPE